MKLFNVLQHGKKLRGTPFDVFGYTAERRAERQWIKRYEQDLQRLSAELAPDIRVNAISPSVTQTPLSEKILSNEQVAESLKNNHPLKRLGTPEDIATLAAFLISEKSGWITGQYARYVAIIRG